MYDVYSSTRRPDARAVRYLSSRYRTRPGYMEPKDPILYLNIAPHPGK
jgi:hypothetical protein